MGGAPRSGFLHALFAWPAVWSVPVGFATMIAVSLATRHRIPSSTSAIMARLHLPETNRPRPSLP
jgi:Na+(H+)/acetate symporter ActP